MDAAGNARAVWWAADDAVSPTNVYVWNCGHSPATGWEPYIGGETSTDVPDVAIDAGGKAVIAWRQSTGTYTNIWVSTDR